MSSPESPIKFPPGMDAIAILPSWKTPGVMLGTDNKVTRQELLRWAKEHLDELIQAAEEESWEEVYVAIEAPTVGEFRERPEVGDVQTDTAGSPTAKAEVPLLSETPPLPPTNPTEGGNPNGL